MNRHWLSLFALLIVVSACVPNKKLVYLQRDDLKNRKSIPKDTVLRVHALQVQEYRIQPLDILNIAFESITSDEYDFFTKSTPQSGNSGGGGGGGAGGNAGLNGIIVDINGDIEYPVVGKIKIAGLTVFEAQQKIQEVGAQYLKDLVVRVRLLNFRFTILGEVNGEKTVTSINTRLNMMEAIGLSGGFTELADKSHVKVIRQKGLMSEVFYVNLLEEKYIESPFYFVQQNDIIIVPPLKQRPFRRYFNQNVALVASTISTVLFIVTLYTTRDRDQ